MAIHSLTLFVARASWLLLTVSTAGDCRLPDRRVVDTANAGDARSESHHGYVGHDAVAGVIDGKPYRVARGWMRYALATFDDTEVTVACTFVGGDGRTRSYDVVVEDSLIATRTFTASAAETTVVEIAVPFMLTKGKTNVAVVIRARGGLTPALRELRIIQDHNEVDHAVALGAAGLFNHSGLSR